MSDAKNRAELAVLDSNEVTALAEVIEAARRLGCYNFLPGERTPRSGTASSCQPGC